MSRNFYTLMHNNHNLEVVSTVAYAKLGSKFSSLSRYEMEMNADINQGLQLGL